MILRILFILAMSCSVAKAQVALAADSLSGLPGSQLDVPIRALQWQDIVSCQGTIEWDTQVVDLDTVYQFGLPGMNPSNFGLSLVPNGKLTFSWNEANLQGTNLADSTPVFVLNFVLTGPLAATSPIAFTSNPTTLEFVDGNLMTLSYNVFGGEVEIEDTVMVGIGEFEVNNLSPNGLSSEELKKSDWRVYPNPINKHSVIEWESRGEAVSWRLLNTVGQVVRSGELKGKIGGNRVGWQEIGKDQLPSGVYWLEGNLKGQRRLEKVLIEEMK